MVSVLAACIVAWLYPFSADAHTPGWVSRWNSCTNNLKVIALAMHNYHDEYRAFPPAVVADSNGRPMHSWRVLILPFLDEGALYDQYNFNQPWDGPNNIKLAKAMPSCFYCSVREIETARRGYTSYFVPVGPDTVWPGTTVRRINEIRDGTSNTVLVMAHHGRETLWIEPKDIGYQEAIEYLSWSQASYEAEHWSESFLRKTLLPFTVALADGGLRNVPCGLDQELTANLLTINDGSKISDVTGYPEARLVHHKYSNWPFVLVIACLYVSLLVWYVRQMSFLRALTVLIVTLIALAFMPGVFMYYY